MTVNAPADPRISAVEWKPLHVGRHTRIRLGLDRSLPLGHLATRSVRMEWFAFRPALVAGKEQELSAPGRCERAAGFGAMNRCRGSIEPGPFCVRCSKPRAMTWLQLDARRVARARLHFAAKRADPAGE